MEILKGVYNKYGYTIYKSEAIYGAGNHISDSHQHAPLNSELALPLSKIKQLCASTLQDLSKELEIEADLDILHKPVKKIKNIKEV
jgi:hypothetical protein